MSAGFTILPPAASSIAARADLLFYALTGFSGLMAVIFIGLIAIFVIRYRKGSRIERGNAPTHARGLEAAWTIAPLLVFLGLFFWAAYDYAGLFRPPRDATPIFVVAKQWMWKAEHLNGRREINELHVPLGRPVRLVMASQDVIHSFFVPAFRVKQDVVPGRYNSLWFKATQEGEYPLLCAEFCGTDHAAMTGRIVVMSPERYARWLVAGHVTPAMAQRGYALFREHGCIGCHSARSTVHAPDLTNLLGRVVHLEDGASLAADETYVRDSILEPQKHIVAGFAPIMPSFRGQLNEEDIMAIIEYIRSTAHDDETLPE